MTLMYSTKRLNQAKKNRLGDLFTGFVQIRPLFADLRGLVGEAGIV